MALGAVVGAALNTAAVRTKALYLGGVDVLKEPVAAPRYATLIESVHVTEVGAGGVSSMEFTIEDPQIVVSVADGMEVIFWNITNDRPYFRGYVDSWDIVNREGDYGRYIMVTATGVEALLDWAIIPGDFSVASGADVTATVQTLVTLGALVGTSPLRAVAGGAAGVSTRAAPVSTGSPVYTMVAPLTITAGTSLRDAITSVLGLATFTSALTPQPSLQVSVDFYLGVRVFEATPYVSAMSDPVSILIDDNDPVTLTNHGEPTTYGADASTFRGVFVKGTGVTAYTVDGSGKVGPTAYIEDSTLTTIAACQAAGTAFLAQYGTVIRGSVLLRDRADEPSGDGWRPGGTISIGDLRLGLAGQQKMMQIDRDFLNSGRMDVEFTYGSREQSVTALMRRLTRRTRS